jgi:hypothetical protein
LKFKPARKIDEKFVLRALIEVEDEDLNKILIAGLLPNTPHRICWSVVSHHVSRTRPLNFVVV